MSFHLGLVCLPLAPVASLCPEGEASDSLAMAVEKNLEEEVGANPISMPHPHKHTPHPPADPKVALARRAFSKLEDGDLKGAVRSTCSENSFTVIDDEALEAKHPPPHPDPHILHPPETPVSLAPISEKELAQAVKSFPAGLAGSPDDLSP